MTATAMIADLGRAGIRLSKRGQRLHVEAPAGTLTADLRQRLADHKADLLAALNDDPIADLRTRLLTLAESEGIDPGLIHALPESELAATVEKIAACNPDEQANILRGYLRALRDTGLRRRGKVPPDETAPALCRHCGPVWVVPEVANAAPKVNGWAQLLGCPWCHVPTDGALAMPRPPVTCGTCRHFVRDTINPDGGSGHCNAGLNPARPYPEAKQYCGSWKGSPAKDGH